LINIKAKTSVVLALHLPGEAQVRRACARADILVT
jgi:hypothetical protein